MASGDMKAVIELSADASGVQSGVQKAMGALNNMAGGVRGFMGGAGGQAISQVFNFARESFDEISARVQEAAHAYSPLAMESAANLQLTQMQSDQRIGQAFGASTATVDAIKAQGIKDVEQTLIDNKDVIGQANEEMAAFGVALEQMKTDTGVFFANLVVSASNIADGKVAQNETQGYLMGAGGAGLEFGANMLTGGSYSLLSGIHDWLTSKGSD